MRITLPSSYTVLLAIGLFDLAMTVWLHYQGLIVEVNPVMRPVLASGEWAFAAVKFATLLIAAAILARHAKLDRPAVMRACRFASLAYVGLLGAAFVFGG